MFNTLMYAKKLEEAGVARQQAEAHVQVIAEILEVNLATKEDIARIEEKLLQLEYRLTFKMGTVVVVAVSAIAAFVKLF